LLVRAFLENLNCWRVTLVPSGYITVWTSGESTSLPHLRMLSYLTY
jgi:hypothetical protein